MDSEYPVLLKEIYQFPLLLFYKGNIKLINNMHHLAVVGARDSTSLYPTVFRIFIIK